MENQDITKFPSYERYKDSGVDWIGEIPEQWKIQRLFSLAKIKSITNCENEDLLSVYLNLGVVKFSDIDEKRTNGTSESLEKYQLVEQGDFVLNNQQAWRGSVGVSSFRGIVSPAYLVLQLSKLITPLFANYLFRDQIMVSQYLIGSRGVGTIQRNLYWDKLKKTEVLLPPLPEQTAIAQFLDHKTGQIDRAIAIKEEQIKLLNERKQIMIQEAVTKGLDPSVPMKDSGVEWIGEIPEHWRIVNFRYLIEFLTDYTANGSFADLAKYVKYLDKPDFSRLIRLTDLRKNLKNEGVYLSRSSHNFLSKSELFGGELLIANVGAYAGLAWLMPEIDYPATLAPNMLLIKTKNNISNSYLFYLLNSYCYSIYLTITAKSAAQPKLNKDDIRELQIVLPPLPEQEKIISFLAQEVNSEGNIVNKIKEQIQALKEYKTTLINEAVTGKIKVN